MISSRVRLWAALVLAAALQAALWFLPPGVGLRARMLEPVSDAQEYHALSVSLAERGAFERETMGAMRPEFFRTPGYPLLLAGLRRVFGSSLAAILGLQLLLSLLTVLVTFRLAREAGLSDRASSLAALLVAASPNLAFHATKVVTETTFTLLLAICLLLLARYRSMPQGRSRACVLALTGAGITAGLLALVRPIALYWPLVIATWVGWRCLRARPRFAWLALVPVLAAGLTVAPWFARNHRLSGRVMFSTAAERNLFLYNAATVIASEQGITVAEARDLMQAEARQRFGELDSTDETGYWARLGVIGRERYLGRPTRAALVQVAGFTANFLVPIGASPLLSHAGTTGSDEPHVMQRALGLAARGRVGEAWQVVRRGRLEQVGAFFWIWFGLAALHVALLLALAAVGLRAGGAGWLVPAVLYFTLLTGPVGEARFRAPAEPALAVIAAVGLARTHRRRLTQAPMDAKEEEVVERSSGLSSTRIVSPDSPIGTA